MKPILIPVLFFLLGGQAQAQDAPEAVKPAEELSAMPEGSEEDGVTNDASSEEEFEHAPLPLPKRGGSRARGAGGAREKEAEGTEAPKKIDEKALISKSEYRDPNGRRYEVDPD